VSQFVIDAAKRPPADRAFSRPAAFDPCRVVMRLPVALLVVALAPAFEQIDTTGARPGGVGLLLHTMYYVTEVRWIDEFRADTSQISTQELERATLLVRSMAGTFAPARLKARYQENLRALIDAQTRGQETAERATRPVLAPVVDILEALKASLARKK
jgi:non-homologous end joining protein Ku